MRRGEWTHAGLRQLGAGDVSRTGRFQIGADVAHRLIAVIAAELLQHGVRQRDAHHRFANDGARRHKSNVTALVVRLFNLFARAKIDSFQRVHNRRDGLDHRAHDNRLSRRHTALKPAGIVGSARPWAHP